MPCLASKSASGDMADQAPRFADSPSGSTTAHFVRTQRRPDAGSLLYREPRSPTAAAEEEFARCARAGVLACPPHQPRFFHHAHSALVGMGPQVDVVAQVQRRLVREANASRHALLRSTPIFLFPLNSHLYASSTSTCSSTSTDTSTSSACPLSSSTSSQSPHHQSLQTSFTTTHGGPTSRAAAHRDGTRP